MKSKVVKGVIGLFIEPWSRLAIMCIAGLVLMFMDSSGGYVAETTWVSGVGVALFLLGILTVPIQWFINYFLDKK